jgi:hypothetical protein
MRLPRGKRKSRKDRTRPFKRGVNLSVVLSKAKARLYCEIAAKQSPLCDGSCNRGFDWSVRHESTQSERFTPDIQQTGDHLRRNVALPRQ